MTSTFFTQRDPGRAGEGWARGSLSLTGLILVATALALWLSGCASSEAATGQATTPVTATTTAVAVAPESESTTVLAGLPLMPRPVTSFGAARTASGLHVLGGYFGRPHDYRPEGQSRALWTLTDEGWTAGTPIEGSLQSVALVAHGEGVHRVGGMRIIAPGELRSVDEHARLVGGRWETLPPLPGPRSSHDAFPLDGKLYVVGGWNLAGNPREASFNDTMAVFADGAWTEKPQPFARRALALATAAGKLVAMGGLGQREPSRAVNIYDPAADAWSEGPEIPDPNDARTGFGVAALGLGNAVYASGRDGVIRRLDLAREELAWEDVGTLVFPRFFHRMVADADGQGFTVVGGISGMTTLGRTALVEHYDVRGDGSLAGEPVLRYEVPAIGAAKNRQGSLLMGDTLYLFGGNSSTGQHDFEAERFQSNGVFFHVPSLGTHEAPAFPVHRQSMTVVPLPEGKALSLGGFGMEAADGTMVEEARTQRDAFLWDGESWSPVAGLPVGRSQIGATLRGDQVFVFGGLDYDATRPEGDQFRHLKPLLAAPAGGGAEFGETGVELPGPRRAFGGAMLGDRYVLVGGMREDFQLVDDCVAYDFASEAFGEFPCPEFPRLNPRLLSLGNGTLLLVGGTAVTPEGLRPATALELYREDTGSWTKLSFELPIPARHLHAQPLASGRVLLLSTHDDEDRAHVILIDPMALAASDG